MPPVVAAAAAAPALFAAGGAVAAGGLGLAGALKSSSTQKKSSDAAIALAREQEANKMRMWEEQQKAARMQWDAMQANLAPYRAARASVLEKYGIKTGVEPPPMPPDFMGGTTPSPAMFAPGSTAGTGAGRGAIFGNPQQMPQEAMNPMGPVPLGGERPQVNPIMLRNWSDWSNYLGQG